MRMSWQGEPLRTMAGVAGVAAVIFASACAEAPTAPAAAPVLDEAAQAASAVEDPPLIPNSRKYADAGNRPSTGRAGSALAAIQALLAKDGSAVVEVVAGEEWTGWTRERSMRADPHGDARLSRVQLKGFDPDGELQFTRNFNDLSEATASLAANGLVRGGRAQVQANVVGADVARTGVVTVDAPVLLRPDLAVIELRRPPRAVRNTAVPIVAVVRELNGDLGAWADCVLYVNGVEADRTYGMWVDAGGTVTCAMMHMFRTVGESRLEVRVERVAPGDYDSANNAATATMGVIFVRSDFFFNAHFRDVTFAERSAYQSRWTRAGGREGGDHSSVDERGGRIQQAYLSAYLPRAVAFPLRDVGARQYTRDETAHTVFFAELPANATFTSPWGRETCARRGFNSATGIAWLTICSHEMVDPEGGVHGFTTVDYDRHAGDVTYASRGHSHYWNRDAGIDDVYTWNYAGVDKVGRFVKYGLEYAFLVRFLDRGTVFSMNPFVGLLPFQHEYSAPRSCWNWQDSWGSMESCSEFSARASGLEGVVFGEPSR